jgi:hypothetical protein
MKQSATAQSLRQFYPDQTGSSQVSERSTQPALAEYAAVGDPPSVSPAPVDTSGAASGRGSARPSLAVSVPRYLLYAQGVLLIIVAISAFVVGILFGRTFVDFQREEPGQRPRRITGTVHYRTQEGAVQADSEAVIIAVPGDRRPDEKLGFQSLRPDDPPPGSTHPAIVSIRGWGGDYARTGPAGNFVLEVPRAGSYFVLLLSGHAARPAREVPPHRHLAEIARYFVPADQLLGDNAYAWFDQRILRDTKIDHTFE